MPLIINQNTNYTITRGSSVVLSKGFLLDYFRDSAASAYSLRKLKVGYTGSAIRVRRTSDNTEQDIGFNYDDQLDTNTLSSFIGSSSGFVTKWYDQSEYSVKRDIVQATAANQPRIALSGSIDTLNGRPAIVFNGATSALTEIQSFVNGIPRGIYTIQQSGKNTGVQNIFRIGSTTPFIHRYNAANFESYGGNPAGSLTITTATNPLNTTLLTSIFTDTVLYQYVNSVSGSTDVGTIGAAIAGANTVGWTSGFSEYFSGSIQEVIIFQADTFTNRPNIEANIGSYYQLQWSGASSRLLNTYTGSAVAYSLRNLSSTYTGPLIRVRRASDNAELDIYGNYTGSLDTSALLAFVGSSSGYVTTWYDQSGNGRNITQTTALNQPYIVSLGVLNTANGRPALFFTLNDVNRLTRSGIISGSTARTQIAVYKPADGTGVSGIFGQGFDAGTGTWSYIQSRTGAASGDPYFAGYSADLGNGLTTKDATLKIGSFIYNGTTGYLWKNNTQVTSGNLTLNTNVNQILQIGNSGGGTGTSNELLQGSIFECILYLSDNLANISAINADINSYYSIY